MNITINLENTGYASPYKERPVQLLLKSKTTGVIRTFIFTTDIRKWFTGAVKLEQAFTLPADMSPGEYELYLNLPDKNASIANRADYAIRLANQDVWEAATGYNKLNHVVVVE